RIASLTSRFLPFTVNCMRAPSTVASQRNLADDPRERHHLDPAGSALAQGGCRGIGGCAAGVDVVDERDPAWRRRGRAKRTGDVAPAFGTRQPALVLDPAGPCEQWDDGQLPSSPALAGERLGRVVSALQHTIAVWRHERQSSDPGT